MCVELGRPGGAAIRRLPHAAVGGAGPQGAVGLDRERAHAAGDDTITAARVGEDGIAVIRVIRVVFLGRELAPRAADKGECLPLLERREERRAGNARAGRVARRGLLEDRCADFVEIAGRVFGSRDRAVRRSAGHGKTRGRGDDKKGEDRERGEGRTNAMEHQCPSQEIGANATPSRSAPCGTNSV